MELIKMYIAQYNCFNLNPMTIIVCSTVLQYVYSNNYDFNEL